MISKIISGGQTGVDRAALDFAIERGIQHGGWCPKGRKAEDGVVPARYKLEEHPSSEYPGRTWANVHGADATVIFVIGALSDSRGSLLTARYCHELKRPLQIIDLRMDEGISTSMLHMLLVTSRADVLNVAGARGSKNPDVAKVKRILVASMEFL